MNYIRASLAAIAIAFAGLAGAGTASAKPILVNPIHHFCAPHYETHSQYLGIRHIGYRFYRVFRVEVVYVNVLCQKRIVRVYYRYLPVFYLNKKNTPGV